MTSLKIEDIRQFTAELFTKETFDHFLVKEAEVVTFNVFTIDGRIRPGYYSEEELREGHLPELSDWAVLRPVCFSLIKGRRLPESFRIILKTPRAAVEKFITGRLSLSPDQVTGLYLNVRYEDGKLSCVTGTSLSFFTLDKALDAEWDQEVKGFFKKNGIVFIEE